MVDQGEPGRTQNGALTLSDWIYRRGGGARLINWLAVDSWLDSSLYQAWLGFKDWWAALVAFFARFRLTGARRVINELASETFTLGLGGGMVMLALALPAFEIVDRDDWLATGKYSVVFLDRYGNEIGKRGIMLNDSVPLEEIPDYLIKATLATEDRRFFSHFGIDIWGTLRALLENVRANEVRQGGSSITQQLAKNLFLTPERSLERKIKEAFIALWLETHLTKKQILKLYLDRAYMGGGAFGVEAASQFYFNKSVRDVTLAEAALLAGLYKAPTRYAPHISLAASRLRTNEVLDNLVEAGFMTEGQVQGARKNPAQIVERSTPDAPNWFLDWAFEEVQRLLAGRGEFVVTARTTIDMRLQEAADTAVQTILGQYSRARNVKQAALVSMEPDGAVVAMVGGRDYGESKFNRAAHAKRQPGSSFKPYVYLTALQNGYRPNTIVVDGPVSCGRWSPRNYSGGYRGRMPLVTALAKSINTVAVKLSLKVGRDKVLENVRKMGIVGPRKSCSMALGDKGITPLEHTGGYAHFANGGKEVRPYGILEIRNSKGELIYSHERDEPKPRQIFDPEHIRMLNYMLGQVVAAGTGRRAQLDFTYAAGKTGTTSGYKDGWFMGYTGKYVTGVWFGNDNFRPTNRVTGGSLPAMTWKLYMVAAHQNAAFPAIPGLPLHPQQAAELARVAALRRTNPVAAEASGEEKGAMAKVTRKILRRLVMELKTARGDDRRDKASTPSKHPKKDRRASAQHPSLARNTSLE